MAKDAIQISSLTIDAVTVGSDEMSIFYLQLTDVAGGGPTGPTSTMFLLGVGK